MRALALLALGVTGCLVGEGKGSVSGTLFVQNCTNEQDYGSAAAPALYNMKPSFFAAEPVDDFQRPHPMNRLAIRIQPTGLLIEQADVLFINIASVRPVAMALGTAIAVGPVTNLRASLQLNSTCPDQQVTGELDGTITFTNFGSAKIGAAVPDDFRVGFDDRLTASFSFDVVDRRASTLGGIGAVSPAPTLGGHLDGDFDFTVRQGRAAQNYP
jgi:hypothetical protein